MTIRKYLDQLEGKSKRHVLLIVTPKDEYPTQYSNEYCELEQSILEKPKTYIELFEDGVPEIMQFTAFRLFIKPLICDKEQLSVKSTAHVRRLNEDEITSFIVVKHFYDTVRYGEKLEEDAISHGLVLATEFLENYPINKFEFATVALGKDTDEANVLINLDLKNKSDAYYFDHVYVN
ncbi:hypothetical protein [Psychrobacillus sp. L3]|uniref:hypothetical protein n=1 Tax=Psychrobacillus sp. L3 TaxID=3236891 RepID=UPI0036F36010